MLKIKTTPKFDFNKYDCGFGFMIHRENESQKYYREYKIINYIFGIVLLWFTIGVEIEVSRKGR